MSTAEATPDTRVLSGLTEAGIVLEGVSWTTYERLLEGLGDRRVFVTYDSGIMEIQTMSPSYAHDHKGRLLEMLVNAICLERDIDIRAGGSVTMRRRELNKGLEADACYWIANEKALRGVEKLDLTKQPPPDLVIEIDIHANSVDRVESYRRLKVREVWWVRRKEGLQFLGLSESGDYELLSASVNFPDLRHDAIADALANEGASSDTAWVKQTLQALGLR